MSTAGLKPDSAHLRNSQEFLFGATHDLKQPVYTIRRFTELLREKPAKEQDQATGLFLAYIREAADGLQTLIDQTLAYAQAEDAWQCSPVNMELVLQFVTASPRSTMLETNAVISSDRLPTVTVSFCRPCPGAAKSGRERHHVQRQQPASDSCGLLSGAPERVPLFGGR